MIIATNIASLNAHRNLKGVGDKLTKASAKLSSGKRINSAADDAAGLAISEKMKAQIRGMEQAQRNTEDGINLIRTMEGGMDGIQDMMIRQCELIIQAMNDTNTSEDREKIQNEIDQLTDEIGACADRVEYNKIPLLNVPSDGEDAFTTEIITETTLQPVYRTELRPTDEVTLNRIEASVTSPPVSNNGMFQFWATNQNADIKSQLLFGGNSPGTSYPTIQINGKNYSIWGNNSSDRLTLEKETEMNGGVWSTTFGLKDGSLDLTVIQNVSVVNNPPDIGGQSYKIEYEVINKNPSVPVTFNFMYHVDTQLGSNDSAPFKVDGQNVVNNTSYNNENLSGRIEIFDDITNPFVNGVIITNSGGGLTFETDSEPDKVNLGRYNSVNTFGDLPPGQVGDSGYSVIWNNRTTTDSEPYVLTTYYGVKNPPAEVLDSLGDMYEVEVFDGYKEVTETREVVVKYKKSNDLWIQNGANSGQGTYLSRYDCRPESLGIKDLIIDPLEEAKKSLENLGAAFGKVNSFRAKAGAQQNRLEHTNNSLAVASENLEQANSRIADADMAREMMELTKANVLQQAATSMLAQANQQPQAVLQLLQA